MVEARAGATPVAVLYDPHVRSVLDSTHVANSIEVGTATAFDRRLGGRTLEFSSRRGLFFDRQTGSGWDITGTAVSGPLHGRQLNPIRHDEQFWFALAAFVPRARIVR